LAGHSALEGGSDVDFENSRIDQKLPDIFCVVIRQFPNDQAVFEINIAAPVLPTAPAVRRPNQLESSSLASICRSPCSRHADVPYSTRRN
jgi:hypothetical protein